MELEWKFIELGWNSILFQPFKKSKWNFVVNVRWKSQKLSMKLYYSLINISMEFNGHDDIRMELTRRENGLRIFYGWKNTKLSLILEYK